MKAIQTQETENKNKQVNKHKNTSSTSIKLADFVHSTNPIQANPKKSKHQKQKQKESKAHKMKALNAKSKPKKDITPSPPRFRLAAIQAEQPKDFVAY